MYIIKRINEGMWRNGTYYYKDPKCTILHREDGPAKEYPDGAKFYYLNNNRVSKKEYIQYINKKYICSAKKARILKRCT